MTRPKQSREIGIRLRDDTRAAADKLRGDGPPYRYTWNEIVAAGIATLKEEQEHENHTRVLRSRPV